MRADNDGVMFTEPPKPHAKRTELSSAENDVGVPNWSTPLSEYSSFEASAPAFANTAARSPTGAIATSDSSTPDNRYMPSRIAYGPCFTERVWRYLVIDPGSDRGAVEYVNAARQHDFTTALANEIAAPDAGVFAGWARTGESMRVLAAGNAGVGTLPP